MFDFNCDGIMDPGEEYLAFKIWEEMNAADEDVATEEMLDILEGEVIP